MAPNTRAEKACVAAAPAAGRAEDGLCGEKTCGARGDEDVGEGP